MKLTRNKADAEDLVQKTFLNAWRAWGDFSPAGASAEVCARGWLFRILHNVFNNHCRHNACRDRGIVLEASDDLGAFAYDPRETFETGPSDEFVAALDALDPIQKDIMLRHADGQKYNQIAAELEIPIGTVMSRLYRGRKKLAEALALAGVRVDTNRLQPAKSLETEPDSVDCVVAGDDADNLIFSEATLDADATW